MSAQILNGRSTRRIGRSTGLPVLRAWGHGGYVFGFTTVDHRHGWWNKKTGEWDWNDTDTLLHYSTCRTLFPEHTIKEITMASSPSPAFNAEIVRHSPHGAATAKRSGNGITVHCVCGDPVLVEAGQHTLSELMVEVAQHGRKKAEQAAASAEDS